MKSTDVIAALKQRANPARVESLEHFFKTEKGGYGEGDQFLSVMVPDSRHIAKQFNTLPINEVEKLLTSPLHEARLTALFILIHQYEKGSSAQKEQVFRCYLNNLKAVNNWDLVDASASKIVGAHLLDKEFNLLRELARSDNLWRRRIAMVATHAFIRQRKFDAPLEIAETLLFDSHDLIHKAVGWMLREIGHRDEQVLRDFLDRWASTMPRTALRYAIERFEPAVRKQYLAMKSRES